jgi:hypothetical protein
LKSWPWVLTIMATSGICFVWGHLCLITHFLVIVYFFVIFFFGRGWFSFLNIVFDFQLNFVLYFKFVHFFFFFLLWFGRCFSFMCVYNCRSGVWTSRVWEGENAFIYINARTKDLYLLNLIVNSLKYFIIWLQSIGG